MSMKELDQGIKNKGDEFSLETKHEIFTCW